jgi:DNA-binding transcriptional regulator YiaG
MTDAEWARAPRVPQVSIIRPALWEQGRYEPDAAARAYLRVIARDPNTVRRALAARTKPIP